MSTTIFLGVKAAGATLPPSCAKCLVIWSLNRPEPSGPHRPVIGVALPLPVFESCTYYFVCLRRLAVFYLLQYPIEDPVSSVCVKFGTRETKDGISSMELQRQSEYEVQ